MREIDNSIEKKTQMKTTTFLMALLIAITLVSSGAVTATTTQTNVIKDDGGDIAPLTIGTYEGTFGGDATTDPQLDSGTLGKNAQFDTRIGVVIYDNDMTASNGLASQEEITYVDEGSWIADDFSFTTPDGSDVCIDDVHWVGVYWNPAFPPGGSAWRINFFEDDGTGNAPGTHYAGPFTIAWANIDSSGGPTYWTLGADIPQVCFPGCGEKFWISIYGYMDFPPQSGWGGHQVPIKNHQSVIKSTWFGVPDWMDVELLFGDAYDQAFQLTQKPDHDVAVIDIVNPNDGDDMCPCIPVTVTVQNFGRFDETGVPVHVRMTEQIWADGFEAGYTYPWMNGCMGCWWALSPAETAPPFACPAPHTGALMAEFDQTSGAGNSCDLYTILAPPLDLTAKCDAKVGFWMWHDSYGSEDYLEVIIDNGGGFNVIGPQFARVDCPGCPSGWVFHEVSIPAMYYTPNVQIGFRGTCGTNGGAYNLMIDDVSVFDVQYDQTVFIDIGVGVTKDVEMPEWCICQWHVLEYPASITVDIEACTEMIGDQIPANDCSYKTVTMVMPCFHDVGAISIDEPVGEGLACIEFDMCATIKNFGQYQECCFTTYMKAYETTIVPDFAPPVFFEDFEHGGAMAPGWTPVIYSGDGEWKIEAYGNDWDEPWPGSGMYYLEADSDEAGPDPVVCFDTGIFTPSINLGTCTYEVLLAFDFMYWNFIGFDLFEVRTYSGGMDPANLEEVLMSSKTSDWGSIEFLYFYPISYADPQDVYIEFYYSDACEWAGDVNIDYVIVDILDTYIPFGSPVYSDEICIEEIDICEEIPLCFDSWTPPGPYPDCGYKVYAIEAETRLCDPPDCNNGNDKVIECIKVDFYHDVAIEMTSPPKKQQTFYGMEVYPGDNVISFDPADPNTVNVIGPGDPTLSAYAGTWFDETWYITDNTAFGLYTVDEVTGAINFVVDTGVDFNGIASDGATMYGVTSTDLYTIDIVGGGSALVGPLGSAGLMIDMAIDMTNGIAYGHDIVDDSIYTIDLLTGAAALVGPTGFDGNYAQGMEYDQDNGILYLALFDNAAFMGKLITIDVGTGAGTEIGTIGTVTMEVTCLAIPYEAGIPEPEIWLPCGEIDLCVNLKNQGTFDEIDDPVSPCDCEGVTVSMELYKWIWDDPCIDPEKQLILEMEECIDILCEEEKPVCFGPVDFDVSGIYELYFLAEIDVANSPPDDCFPSDNTASLIFGIDCCPPETSHILSPDSPDGDNNWYTDDVTVKVTGVDPLCPDPCIGTNSGMKEIHYTINGDETTKVGSTATFKVTDDGVNFVTYWGVDQAGNIGDVSTFEIAIDSTPPTVDLVYTTFEEGEQWKVTLTANAGDATSSLDKVEFYVGANLLDTLNTPPWEITENWQSGWGGQTFKATAYDNAGNSASDTVVITVSKDAQTTTTTLPVSINKVLILQR